MLHCLRAVWRRDRRDHSAQLWDGSFMLPSLSWWAEIDVPCSAASAIVPSLKETGRVVCYSQILHSCILLTLVFTPQNVHRKHIVVMPSGRLSECDAKSIFILILQSSHSPCCDICPGLRVHFGWYAFAKFWFLQLRKSARFHSLSDEKQCCHGLVCWGQICSEWKLKSSKFTQLKCLAEAF